MTDIVVLGSTNMDLVAYVAKPPQRGETVTGREFRTIPGGKGANQATAAAHAGGAVSLIGAVGNDSFGARLRSTLEHAGVNTDHLRTVEAPSGTAHIVVDDDGGNAIVVVPGANGTVDHLAPGDEGLIASSYALLLQLEVPLAAVVAGARAARAHGVRTILTPSGPGEGEIETTASALLAYAMMKGARLGLLSKELGEKGRTLAKNLDAKVVDIKTGSVTGISCPTTAMPWKFYYTHIVGDCPDESYGVGAVLLMLDELEKP